MLRSDVARLNGVSPGLMAIVRCFFGRAGFQAVFFYRIASALQTKGTLGRGVARIFARLNIWFNGCDISPECRIGEGLKLPHPVGIVIGPCRIGRNAMILQNVTIGMRRFSDDENSPDSYPDIGDDVTISSGAAILGGVRVGRGSLIGANAVVMSDLPDSCLAVGVPASIRLNRAGVALC